MGRGANVVPAHTAGIGAKLGVTRGVTNTSMVTGTAQLPAGVNVSVEVPGIPVSMVAGLQVPVTPLFEVPGNVGAADPWQIGAICVKLGVIVPVISTLTVTGTAQPPVGVKLSVDVPGVPVLMVAGLQVPVTPLSEMLGKEGATDPWQSGPMGAKIGMMVPVTTISMVACVAQPPEGVNVYVVVPIDAVLIVAGLQLPLMPFAEVPGNAGAVAFWQNGPSCVKPGVIVFVTVTTVLAVPEHPLASVTVTL